MYYIKIKKIVESSCIQRVTDILHFPKILKFTSLKSTHVTLEKT